MKLLTFKITPQTPFGTYPKGDTLFGQIASYFYMRGFDGLQKPRFVVSDMMPLGYVYKPSLPMKCFGYEDKKSFRKKNFITIEDLQSGDWEKICEVDFFRKVSDVKNSISRLTFSTQGKDFAPYSVEAIEFYRELWMFALVDEEIEQEFKSILEEIGVMGFGKDSSVGKGKFSIETIDTPSIKKDKEWVMALSPVALCDVEVAGYEPFVRFGKFGLDRAHKNAFKKPVMVADSGAVVKLKKKQDFFGKMLENGNERFKAFYQGCSIALPIKEPQCLSK